MTKIESKIYAEKLTNLSHALEDAVQKWNAEKMDLVKLARDAEEILEAIAQNPQCLGKENAIHLQHCLDLLQQLEARLNDQMNQWVMTMNFSR
jgi:DICT domain-containing protein